MATFMERLAFLQKVPTLMKATADDENPCPGYLFQEIEKISHESTGYGQCLLEYLLERLLVESCHVKLKVLKIFVHLCGHGSNQFLTELRRNSTFIQQASVYSGPPDPIHGTALYQKVRNTAQEVARLLFTDTISAKSSIYPLNVPPPSMGMGSGICRRSGLQGFGYNPGKQGAANDSLLNKIQKAAEVVASAVLPPTEHQGIRLHENNYRAVVAPSAPIEVAMPACAYNMSASRPKALTTRCPGQVGGGWEETDSSNSSSHNSSQDIAANSKSAGSQSGASRESSGDLSERVEALHLGDCGQEMALISRLTEGSKVFLSREESQHFIKECSILNCEVVLELLSRKLQDPSNTAKMRALCALSCLLTSDLLSLEQMFGATQRRLLQLGEGAPGPVANKATKILRQFEALMGGSPHTPCQDAANNSHRISNNQLPTSTYSGLLLSSHSNDDTNINCCKPDVLPVQLQSHPSSSFSLALAQGDSTGELTNNCSEDEHSPIQKELVQNQLDQSLTAEAESDAEEQKLKTEKCSSSPDEPQQDQSCSSRLSLFSGMELVTKGRPLCHKESDLMDKSLKVNLVVHKNIGISETNDETSSVCNSVSSESSQQVSAFSFVNF
ncbi:AP-4 complex accessory subunit Tepsin isoform X2 [Antennarius striatus]|uniref:AP-4 complex accessory subunit Tepsin isoform X2 n=1 Tax=Antennarius striatus TaxID=241820 RepID=UPI0035B34628